MTLTKLEGWKVRNPLTLPAMFVFAGLLIQTQAAGAQTYQVDFERLTGTVAQGTTIFRADLSSIPLSEIRSITLVDSNSKTGGSPGHFSGFDLDAIKLSYTFATTAAQASSVTGLDVFDFQPGGTLFRAIAPISHIILRRQSM